MWVLNLSLDMHFKAVERKWYFQDEGVSLTATPGSSMDGASRTGQQVMMIVMMIDRWEAKKFCINFSFIFVYVCICVSISFHFLFLWSWLCLCRPSGVDERQKHLFVYICAHLWFVFVFICICVSFTFYSYYPGCVSVVPWETRRRQKWHAFAANGKTWHETQLTRSYFCNCFVLGDWFISNILYFLFLAANGNSWHKTQFQSNCIFVICICWLITWYYFLCSIFFCS